MSMVACGCYQMATIASGKYMILPKTVATEGHISDGQFGHITDDPL
jgi:hypothetical protein